MIFGIKFGPCVSMEIVAIIINKLNPVFCILQYTTKCTFFRSLLEYEFHSENICSTISASFVVFSSRLMKEHFFVCFLQNICICGIITNSDSVYKTRIGSNIYGANIKNIKKYVKYVHLLTTYTCLTFLTTRSTK